MKKLVIIPALLFVCTMLNAQNRRIIFEIHDTSNKPIEGVDIFSGDIAKCRTDSNGKAPVVWEPGQGKMFFRAVRTGYQTESGIHVPQYTGGADTMFVRITLVPLR